MDDLAALFPSTVTVTLAGEQFTLTAFKARHTVPYLNINRRITAKAAEIGQELATAAAAMGRDTAVAADEIPMDLVHERCYPEYVELVATAINRPTDWIEDTLDIDELITLAGIINQLNAERYSKKRSALIVTADAQSK
ncbi:hypothetical protein RugamoR57_37570 [Duganella caerulea]|uniref:hypothetical protein n=1 Tax=Duganella caerulea TaxID=2885762 RepID=UPI0030E7EFAE